MKKLWHYLLVHFGIRPCCDNREFVENHSSVYYYEYECKNCGYIKSASLIETHM